MTYSTPEKLYFRERDCCNELDAAVHVKRFVRVGTRV